MNEQRLQAYLNFIDALLNCLCGEEPRILAHSDLVVAGLVQGSVPTVRFAIAQLAEEDRGIAHQNYSYHLLLNLNFQSFSDLLSPQLYA